MIKIYLQQALFWAYKALGGKLTLGFEDVHNLMQESGVTESVPLAITKAIEAVGGEVTALAGAQAYRQRQETRADQIGEQNKLDQASLDRQIEALKDKKDYLGKKAKLAVQSCQEEAARALGVEQFMLAAQ